MKAQLKAILEFPMADDSLSAPLLPEGSCVIRECEDLRATLSRRPENQGAGAWTLPQPPPFRDIGLILHDTFHAAPQRASNKISRLTRKARIYRSCTSLYPTAVRAQRPTAELPKEGGMAWATYFW